MSASLGKRVAANRERCKAIVKDWYRRGEPCMFPARENGYCGTHDPARAKAKLAQRISKLRQQLRAAEEQLRAG